MWRALLVKEFRECGLYAVIALVVQIMSMGESSGIQLLPRHVAYQQIGIPFLSADWKLFTNIAIAAAIVVGLQQTVWESWRQTTLFLLHRPIPRTQIVLAKLTAGFLLMLGINVLPLAAYILKASSPGVHPSPFFWELTEAHWRGIVIAIVCYLGAFLTGIRPANLIGSRTWPVMAALVLGELLHDLHSCLPAYLGLIALMIGLTISILQTAQCREYP